MPRDRVQILPVMEAQEQARPFATEAARDRQETQKLPYLFIHPTGWERPWFGFSNYEDGDSED